MSMPFHLPPKAQKTAIAVAVGAALYAAWRFYGWPGVVVVFTAGTMWVLLHVHRTLAVLRRAAKRPIGHVDSAVMLGSKLHTGQTLLHVVALTRSLGQLVSEKDVQPEVYRWADAGGAAVTATFARGRLTQWDMRREAAASDADTDATTDQAT